MAYADYCGKCGSSVTVCPVRGVCKDGPTRVLACDMHKDCGSPVTHIDEKGFVYCESHDNSRKSHCRCRKLKPAELKQLLRSEPLAKY